MYLISTHVVSSGTKIVSGWENSAGEDPRPLSPWLIVPIQKAIPAPYLLLLGDMWGAFQEGTGTLCDVSDMMSPSWGGGWDFPHQLADQCQAGPY